MSINQPMCKICGHNAVTLPIDGYIRCEYCKTYITKVLPNNKKVQKVLEEHAETYILDKQETGDNHSNLVRLYLLNKFTKSTKTVLDFGCGSGSLVKYLLSNGYKAFAYDKSEIIKKYLASQSIPFYEKLSEIPNNYFDVVTCFDVIEHVTNPNMLIQNIKRKIKKGGILVLSTPNSRGLSAKILGKKWWVFGPTAHFVLFSPYSIKLLITKMGLEVLDLSTDTITPWFTPSEKFVSKIINKLLYLIILPFQKVLFSHYLGDNIQVIVRTST